QELDKLATVQGVLSPLAESLRMLRLGLGPRVGQGPRVILITSAAPGEGKSFIAAHFATLLAREGNRVLLVDTDLRRPSLHKAFNLELSPGIAQFISNGLDTSLASLTYESGLGVSLIPAGEMSPQRGEQWDDSSVEALLRRMRDLNYEYIIVDTPPVLVAASTCLLAKRADDVLLVVRSGASRERDLKEARGHLDRSGARIRGIVLNDEPEYSRPSYIRNYYRLPEGKASSSSRRDGKKSVS
ncbi:MAG: CpsD/CapB family tyrosine-protein kinase, partial [Vicinamibacteria bacterium]